MKKITFNIAVILFTAVNSSPVEGIDIKDNDLISSASTKTEIKIAEKKVNRKGDLFVTGSFIYWEPNTTWGYNYCNFDFNPGFKIGIGKCLGKTRWLLDAEYTWLHYTKYMKYDEDKYRGTTGFDMLDVSFSRPFSLKSSWFFVPHIGSRVIWTHIDSYVKNGFLPETNLSELEGLDVGPRIGIDMFWKWNCSLSLIGKLSSSVLHSRTSYRNYLPENMEGDIWIDDKDTYNTWNTVSDAFVGFGYDGFCFSKKNISLAFSSGYEILYFWDISYSYDSGFYFHGLTLSGKLSF